MDKVCNPQQTHQQNMEEKIDSTTAAVASAILMNSVKLTSNITERPTLMTDRTTSSNNGWTRINHSSSGNRRSVNNNKNEARMNFMNDTLCQIIDNNNDTDTDHNNKNNNSNMTKKRKMCNGPCCWFSKNSFNGKRHLQRLYNTTDTSMMEKQQQQLPNFYNGIVVFCLPDNDPQWFQGYFFPTTTTQTSSSSRNGSTGRNGNEEKDVLFDDDENDNGTNGSRTTNAITIETTKNPTQLFSSTSSTSTSLSSSSWGILCQQEEIDDCLQCQQGGYRQLSISINTFVDRNRNDDKITIPTTMKFRNIVWTGGDMMNLSTTPTTSMNNNINNDNTAKTTKEYVHSQSFGEERDQQQPYLYMETKRILMNTNAVPYIEKYFTSLVRLLKQHHPEEEDDSNDKDDKGIEDNVDNKEDHHQDDDTNNGTKTRTTTTATSNNDVLKYMPNVAIVIGTMTIQYPTTTIV